MKIKCNQADLRKRRRRDNIQTLLFALMLLSTPLLILFLPRLFL